MATNYDINYEDERFQQVDAEKEQALSEITGRYDQMINSSDQYYQDQIDALKDYANTQNQIQDQNTQFTIDQINQQKDQTEKDYTKEQKGAYADWQKQSNQYGANAEQMASSGLTNTGYSESSQVSMYNQYQGRVATARESFNRAVLNYDNQITQARLENSATKAEIAFNTLQAQLQLSLEGFQYKNSLISEQITQQQATEDRYYSRWQDVLNQMNQENQFQESIRQYEQNYQFQIKQFEEEKRQFEQTYTQQIKEFEEGIRQFDEQMEYYREKDAEENAYKIKQLELQKEQLKQEQKQWEKEYELKQKEFAEAQRQYNKTYSLNKQKVQQEQVNLNGNNPKNTQVKTKYYSGAINPDTKYGTFKTTDVNGVRYQPNNVGGSKLSDTKLTIENNGVTQTIWESEDGKYYYWEGRENKYKQMSSGQVNAMLIMKKVNDYGNYLK